MAGYALVNILRGSPLCGEHLRMTAASAAADSLRLSVFKIIRKPD
jgi:hypothetical protein